MSTARVALTIAALTLREAARRRVLLALAVLTVVLLALSAWGFARLAAESGGTLTTGEPRLTASIVLNLVMFGYSIIAALGTPSAARRSCSARGSAWSRSAAASSPSRAWPR